jgi:signal transduction histidine kinase
VWFAPASAPLPEPIAAILREAGWQQEPIMDADTLRQQMEQAFPDVIITNSSDDPSLADWIEQFPDERPLLVWVQARDSDASNLPIDLTLQPQPSSTELHALRTLLRLRQDNVQLQQRLQAQTEAKLGFDRLKNAIVRNVAHELRTPLLQIKTAVKLMREDRQDQFDKLIDLAQVATSRLELSVRNITLLNKLINESLDQPEFAPFHADETAESATRHIRRVWQHQAGLEHLHVDIRPGLPLVMGDRHLISIAIQQLLDNALKFGEQRPILFSVSPGGAGGVRFLVQDEGIGIDPSQHERIFDWFYQVDTSSTRSYGGIGAGLAIVYFILERHQSQVVVESAIGAGSRFYFDLPGTSP